MNIPANLKEEKGVTLVLIAILLVVLIGAAALAVDIGHLVVVRNELQNAADAGALAGARELYYDETATPTELIGTVNPDSNGVALNTALKNLADNINVDINDALSNDGDIQRGHWSFSTRTFTPNSSLEPVTLIGKTFEELDVDPNLINAVRVITRRQKDPGTPATSYFAGIFGYDDFEMEAEAVAYIGYAGTIGEGEIDVPLAICEESILSEDGETYTCNIGRLINSSSKLDSNTGGWTNYGTGDTDSSCPNFNSNDLSDIISFKPNDTNPDCDGGNAQALEYGDYLSVGGGQVNTGFESLRKCGEFWTLKEREKDATLQVRTEPWKLKVPIVQCGDASNISGCFPIVGAVEIQVVMITSQISEGDEISKYEDIPPSMGGVDLSGLTGKARWDKLVDEFNLEIRPEVAANDDYYQMSVYATRECTPVTPLGVTGGKIPAVLAEIPKLVD